VAGAEDKRPRHVLVVGNLFKRAAWGADAESNASALVTAADDVSFAANLYQFAGHEPAPTEGMPSPLQAAAFARCTRISFTGNALAGVGAMLPLGPPAYAWLRSGADWYLARPRNAGGNPWLRRPEDIVLRTVSGNGAWRNADWSFGDHDGLGYETIYLRGDDPTTNAVHAVYAEPPVSFADCADVRTDDVRDFAAALIGPGAESATLLRTRLLGWPAGTRSLRLFVSLRSDGEGLSADGLFELVLTCRRERPVGTSCITRKMEAATSRLTLDVVGQAAEMTLEVRPAPLGDEVEVVLRNTTGRTVEAGLSLLW
jgi:hypothetical protein